MALRRLGDSKMGRKSLMGIIFPTELAEFSSFEKENILETTAYKPLTFRYKSASGKYKLDYRKNTSLFIASTSVGMLMFNYGTRHWDPA